jgi:hypothetical protein
VADNPRAFRTLGAGLQLSWPGPDGDGQGSVTLGLRDVAYKPDPDFAWTGPYLAVHLETTLWRSADDTRTLELAGDVRSEHRAYAGRALAWRCPADAPYQPRCTGPTEPSAARPPARGADRDDLHRERVLSAAYQLGYADSSSFGQSTLRHRLDLAATTELPGRIYATLTLTAQLDQYLDGLIIARDVAARPSPPSRMTTARRCTPACRARSAGAGRSRGGCQAGPRWPATPGSTAACWPRWA